MYTRELSSIIQSYNISFHKYADDIQLYTDYIPGNINSTSSAIERLQQCILHIKSWMSVNNLKLNHEKSELLTILSPLQFKRFGTPSLEIDGVDIQSSDNVKVLGVVIDRHLNMDDQVTAITKVCNYHLRNVGRVRHLIPETVAKNVIHALIISRIDYCCSLLVNTTQYNINRLQRIQNKAARIITLSLLSDHISPIFQRLHWLPVELRIHFRVAVFVFKCLISAAPCYLQSLISLYTPSRRLRSAGDPRKLDTILCKKVAGTRSFSFSAASCWNVLSFQVRMSQNIDSFKRGLKTELFRAFLQ